MRMRSIATIVTALLTVGAVLWFGFGSTPQDPSDIDAEIILDCDAEDANCSDITIANDPIDHGCLVVDGEARFDPCGIRGQFDPSLAQDRETGLLWMAYTDVTLFFPEPDDIETVAAAYETHLARSADHGASWQFVATLTTAQRFEHPRFGGSVIGHEVPDLTQNPDGSWSLLWLHYTRPYGAVGFNDPVIARKDAPTPADLADAPTQYHLSGEVGSPSFAADYQPASGLDNCTGLTEPAIFTAEGRTFVVVECVSVEIVQGVQEVQWHEGRIELFEWFAEDERYEHRGSLTEYTDAREMIFGAAQNVSLTQPTVAQARDGSWLLLVTPLDDTREIPYQGCRVLTIDDLDTGTIQRDEGGSAVVRAAVVAESGHLGAGQCSYHAQSETGVVFTRGLDSADELRLNLVATGLHP